MRKIFYIFIILATVVSCYKDKGNYTYDDSTFKDIKVLLSDGTTVQAPDSLYSTAEFQYLMSPADQEITIGVKAVDENDDYTVMWIETVIEDGLQIKDTTINESMTVNLQGNTLAGRAFVLVVRDNRSTLEQFTDVSISITKPFLDSFFVIHGNKEEDLKLGNTMKPVTGDDEVITDAYGQMWRGERTLDLRGTIDIQKYATGLDSYLVITRGDGQESYHLAPFVGLTETKEDGYVLPDGYENFDIDKIFLERGPQADEVVAVNSENKHLWGAVGNIYANTDLHYLADNASVTDYSIDDVCFYDSGFLVWDATGNRVLYENTSDNNVWGNPVMLYSSLSDMGIDDSILTPEQIYSNGSKELINMDVFTNDDKETSYYLFMKDKETNKLYQYTITSSSGGKGGDDSKGGASSGFAISNCNELEIPEYNGGDIDIFICSGVNSMLYITYKNQLIRYYQNDGFSETIYSAPEGYEISEPRILFEDPYDILVGRSIYFISNTETQGMIHLIEIGNSGDIVGEPKTWAGFEKIRAYTWTPEYF